MIRRSLNRTLRRVYLILATVLLVSAAAKLSDHIPGLKGQPVVPILNEIYEFLRDMALVLVTVIAAYLANVFQKRATFVDALKQEWRGIVATKLALVTFCEKSYPSSDEYLEAYCQVSGALDNMRIVYRNVGETEKLVGLYPYSPLHDMRRALETLDPRANGKITSEQRDLVRRTIEQTFYALRERFLDELDLEEPSHPLTASVTSRRKLSGATGRALADERRQRQRLEAEGSGDPEVNELLSDLYYAEMAKDHARERRPADSATSRPPGARSASPEARVPGPPDDKRRA